MSITGAITREIELPYPHEYQRDVLLSDARFRVVVCGRRWGKTTTAMIAAVEAVVAGELVWWVLPTYPMASEVWRDLKATLETVTTYKSETERRIEVVGGGAVVIKSGDKPDSLRGVGLDMVIVDEAAMISDEAWFAALRPTLSSTQGNALLISTPKGRNWFYRLYQRGLDPLENDWQSWNLPTSTSPTVPLSEIEDAQRELPMNIFNQEYRAEFIEDAGVVFRNIRACISPYPHSSPIGKHRFVMGVDWALVTDFTVLVVIDTDTKQVADIDRFNQIDWPFQRERLITMAKKWRVQNILAEYNSIGGPNISELNRINLPVKAFDTNNKSKTEVIQALAVAFEQGEIGIPDNPVLIGELEAFEAERLPSGKWRYAAPSGMHDDTVIALALAWEAANTPPSIATVQVSGLYASRGRR
jgi:phage FluMu gp28-like protein